MSAKIFKGEYFNLHKISVLSLGLLYAAGSLEDKLDVILTSFDN